MKSVLLLVLCQRFSNLVRSKKILKVLTQSFTKCLKSSKSLKIFQIQSVSRFSVFITIPQQKGVFTELRIEEERLFSEKKIEEMVLTMRERYLGIDYAN
jgi:hypothetical protein